MKIGDTMIQRIEIIIRSGLNITTNALILPTKNICYLNDKKYQVTESFLNELLNTIHLWNHEYGYDDGIDTEEFEVIVKTTDGKDTFHGKGYYPHNYAYLKELLSDIYD